MKIFFYILATILALISLAISYSFGKHIPFEVQVKILDSLRDTSAVIMTVLGIWLAILKPTLLSKLFDGERVSVDNETNQRIQTLTIPFVIATVIVCFEIFIPWIALVLKQVPALTQYKEYLRLASFFIISLLCLIQLLSILLALIPVGLIYYVSKINKIATHFTRKR